MIRRLLVVLAVFAAASVWAGAAFADTRVGQTFPPDSAYSGGYIDVQTAVASGQSFTIPSRGRLTSWSVRSDASVSPMALVVVRPAGAAHTWEVIGVSPVVTPTANTLDTFSISIPVHTGDVIGYWNQNTFDGVKSTGDSGDLQDYIAAGSAPSVGYTAAYAADYPGYVLDISATLLSASAQPPDHMFVCYSKFEQDGGEVETYDLGEAQISAGSWSPVALPGNISGGDNLGDYHLACNPPAGAAPTGQYISDGGVISGIDQTGWYAIDALTSDTTSSAVATSSAEPYAADDKFAVRRRE